jgi:hypothetical protein
MQQLVGRLPQLLEQIAAFLHRELQLDVITIDDGEFAGDPLAPIGGVHQRRRRMPRRRTSGCGLGSDSGRVRYRTLEDAQAHHRFWLSAHRTVDRNVLVAD